MRDLWAASPRVWSVNRKRFPRTLPRPSSASPRVWGCTGGRRRADFRTIVLIAIRGRTGIAGQVPQVLGRTSSFGTYKPRRNNCVISEAVSTPLLTTLRRGTLRFRSESDEHV